ncbi:MAG: DEAD/DEAH box helicase [Clostridia bacterium]|nr:DEAD/DEAH box helicase [Clostridia bacterium]
MSTVSGKSLVFYFASILQPLPIFIISPTDILIDDQIRNLWQIHNMDSVSHLKLTKENDFGAYQISANINYLTPATFQNRNLLVAFRAINNGKQAKHGYEKRYADGPLLSYIVLDEIHCISNWGHDFRPEYLMLSKFLKKFLDQTTFLGFTATANYTIVSDIQKQLDIKQDKIFSPILFEKANISYNFIELETPKERIKRAKEIATELIRRNQRTIIFTKNDDYFILVSDAIGDEAALFVSDYPLGYQSFDDGKCKVLVASEDLGVGINLPNVQNVIHFGLPISKSEYLQEIGRAGRAEEAVTSYVLYLNADGNAPAGLLKRTTDGGKYIRMTM